MRVPVLHAPELRLTVEELLTVELALRLQLAELVTVALALTAQLVPRDVRGLHQRSDRNDPRVLVEQRRHPLGVRLAGVGVSQIEVFDRSEADRVLVLLGGPA